MLVFLIAFPLFAYHLASHGFQDELIQNSDSTAVFQEQVVELFLTIPLYNLLTFFGFESFAEGNMLHFRLVDGGRASVEIAESCSGIYTMIIFISAFSSFVLIEFNKFSTT